MSRVVVAVIKSTSMISDILAIVTNRSFLVVQVPSCGAVDFENGGVFAPKISIYIYA